MELWQSGYVPYAQIRRYNAEFGPELTPNSPQSGLIDILTGPGNPTQGMDGGEMISNHYTTPNRYFHWS